MGKEESIKTFAKSLKHQIGLAMSKNECYQFSKIVWNTAENWILTEQRKQDLNPQSDFALQMEEIAGLQEQFLEEKKLLEEFKEWRKGKNNN